MRRLVLIFGANGQLGEAMAAGLAPRHEVVARGRTEVDVAVPAQVREAILSLKPDLVVNCSAYTNVDGAESAPEQALAVNAWAVRTMARAARDAQSTFVHYSTDFVFDGEATTPYGETDAPNPRGVYAMSKLIGEWFAADAERYYVLRVESLFGGPRAKSSIDRLLEGLQAGQRVRAFADRIVSPSYVHDVVTVTEALVDRTAPYGLYHCVNTGHATWVDVARELAAISGKPESLVDGVNMSQAQLLAPRPQFAALSNAKLTALGIELPTWQHALARYCR